MVRKNPSFKEKIEELKAKVKSGDKEALEKYKKLKNLVDLAKKGDSNAKKKLQELREKYDKQPVKPELKPEPKSSEEDDDQPIILTASKKKLLAPREKSPYVLEAEQEAKLYNETTLVAKTKKVYDALAQLPADASTEEVMRVWMNAIDSHNNIMW